MSLYTDLLFLHGHIANADLATQLAPPSTAASDLQPNDPNPAEAGPREPTEAGYQLRSWRYPMRLFQAVAPLDEAPASIARLGVGDAGYAATYGNRAAWERRFPGFGRLGRASPPRPCQA